MPNITDLGFTLNRTDVSSLFDYNNNATENIAAINAAFADPNSNLATSGISGDSIAELNVEKLTTGTMTSRQVTLAVQEGHGDVYFGAGKTDFTTVETGFILGIDDS